MIYTEKEQVKNELEKLFSSKEIKKVDIASKLNMSRSTFNAFMKKDLSFSDVKRILDVINYAIDFEFVLTKRKTNPKDIEKFSLYCEKMGLDQEKVLSTFIEQFVNGELFVKSTSNGLQIDK